MKERKYAKPVTMFRPFLFQNEIYVRCTTSLFFFFLEQFQSHASLIPDHFSVAQPGSFAPPGFELSGGSALLSDFPGLPAAAQEAPRSRALQGTIQPLPNLDFFFPCYARYCFNELADFASEILADVYSIQLFYHCLQFQYFSPV